jgi:hypothetical protein
MVMEVMRELVVAAVVTAINFFSLSSVICSSRFKLYF